MAGFFLVLSEDVTGYWRQILASLTVRDRSLEKIAQHILSSFVHDSHKFDEKLRDRITAAFAFRPFSVTLDRLLPSKSRIHAA